MGTVVHEQAPVASPQVGPVQSLPQIPNPADHHTSAMDVDDQSSLRTPTKDTFAATGTTQEPQQPSTPTGPDSMISPDSSKGTPSRADSIVRTDSLRSNRSVESGDVDMEDDDDEGSDNESVTSETGRPSKKKKGQRFFCTDFPPCQLSFTRSEHLARHIRKHTGERPFQCHCLRRFSRLDNLRQHAQTVHVNEEIPGDSLAATGTRFQRQIRTDRMRAPGSRARASTISSSSGGHSRGHSRNFSGSSIGSISDIGSPDDGRRRPQPLAMAQTPPRTGLTVDPYVANSAGHEPHYPYYHQSPSTYGTPPSVYNNDASSPMSTLQSPIAMSQRPLTWGERLPGRRLSVPSASAPFQAAAPYNPSMTYMSPLASSNASTFSNSSSLAQSPTSSGFSDSRRDSIASEAEIRRRTWHPGTYPFAARPATSGLSYYQTPDAPKPLAATQPAAAQSVRLPGIDSFDRATERADAPPRRALSPMEVDSSPRQHPLTSPTAHLGRVGVLDSNDQRRAHQPGFAQSAFEGKRNEGPSHPGQSSNATYPPTTVRYAPQPLNLSNEVKSTSHFDEPPITPRNKKRHGWYNGPLPGSQEPAASQAPRTSPEGSSSSDGLPTPSNASGVEYHPAIVHSNGDIESMSPGVPEEHSNNKASTIHQHAHPYRSAIAPGRPSGDMDRLDALVAVATSENRAVENR